MTAGDLLLILGTLLIVCSLAWLFVADVVAVTIAGGGVLFLFGFWATLTDGGGE
jgi:hypothetical protein